MGPFLERVKKHLGKGFETWYKKQKGDPEQCAYRYVERHNIQNENYDRLKASKECLEDQLALSDEHLEQLGTQSGDPDYDEWQHQIDLWRAELHGIKLDEAYKDPI